MTPDVDFIASCGFGIDGRTAAPIVERNYRASEGSLSIPASAFARLFIDHSPDTYFVDSEHISSFPVNLFWRVGRNAMVVHATHYHPICIRPSGLALPFEITIDPVDGRFLDKRLFDKHRVHYVRDTSISGLTLEANSEPDGTPRESRRMAIEGVGFWLWPFMGQWRAIAFESPIKILDGPAPPAWVDVVERARETATAIIKAAEAHEEDNRRRKSWATTGSF